MGNTIQPLDPTRAAYMNMRFAYLINATNTDHLIDRWFEACEKVVRALPKPRGE